MKSVKIFFHNNEAWVVPFEAVEADAAKKSIQLTDDETTANYINHAMAWEDIRQQAMIVTPYGRNEFRHSENLRYATVRVEEV